MERGVIIRPLRSTGSIQREVRSVGWEKDTSRTQVLDLTSLVSRLRPSGQPELWDDTVLEFLTKLAEACATAAPQLEIDLYVPERVYRMLEAECGICLPYWRLPVRPIPTPEFFIATASSPRPIPVKIVHVWPQDRMHRIQWLEVLNGRGGYVG